ncbi:23S rRNA pseudouridine(955/2504/2580) synthase RluC [Motiliproteus sediminis]|uniref:23S rRNA pseudouridine(955/2504/2580) synthase RluC n=1 Tax=Motiliproteus sediminis TaxID=1468178 RepID=UPI001AEFE965|nr:23S rRNA pseudouridine(955/2504/2580) synthase RluC [Motiliproteus sediminis]
MAEKNDVPRGAVRWVEIDSEMADQRIDNFLITFLKGAPKTLIYRILRKGEVRVNKGRVQASYRLRAGDLVRVPPVRLPEPKALPAPGRGLAQLLESAVLFENDQLLIVNKPSGLAVHGGSGVSLGLIEALRQMRPEARFLELVHRLDRDTSGCVMVAKKRSALKALHEDLRRGKISKIYHALVAGKWPKRKVQVNAPLKKNELKSGERVVRADAEGKESLTQFRVLRNLGEVTLVEARPVTGRTHQIRVHTQFAGHPIVGDPKYGDDAINRQLKAQGVDRLFLHAAELRLRLPGSGERVVVCAPLEDKLVRAVEHLAHRVEQQYQQQQ